MKDMEGSITRQELRWKDKIARDKLKAVKALYEQQPKRSHFIGTIDGKTVEVSFVCDKQEATEKLTNFCLRKSVCISNFRALNK